MSGYNELRGGLQRLRLFPGQHHAVANGQTDILDSRVRLHKFVERYNGVVVGAFGIEYPPAPQDIVCYD